MPSLDWSTFPMRGPIEDAIFAALAGSAAACCSRSALKKLTLAASPSTSFALKIACSSALSMRELLPPTNRPSTSCWPVREGSRAWRFAAVSCCCPASLLDCGYSDMQGDPERTSTAYKAGFRHSLAALRPPGHPLQPVSSSRTGVIAGQKHTIRQMRWRIAHARRRQAAALADKAVTTYNLAPNPQQKVTVCA